MPTLQDVYDRLHFVSDRLSSQVRLVALGVLALSWGLLIGESKTATEVAETSKDGLLFVGGLAILTMFFDFLQYVCSYLDANRVKKEGEDSHSDEVLYDATKWTYRWQNIMFWSKQVLLSVTVVSFLFLISKFLLKQ